MSKRSSKKTPPPKLTAAQKAANHKANYNWLDVVKPGRGPGYAAEEPHWGRFLVLLTLR
jgi:hypothetical protein